MLQLFFLYVPLAVGGALHAGQRGSRRWTTCWTRARWRFTSAELYVDALVLSLVLFFGFVVVGLAVLFTVPRVLSLVIKPDKVYPLYGFHYSAHRAIARMTNIKFFNMALR